MKTALKVIKDLVRKYPNDMELGSRVRYYIRWLKDLSTKKKGEQPKYNWKI